VIQVSLTWITDPLDVNGSHPAGQHLPSESVHEGRQPLGSSHLGTWKQPYCGWLDWGKSPGWLEESSRQLSDVGTRIKTEHIHPHHTYSKPDDTDIQNIAWAAFRQALRPRHNITTLSFISWQFLTAELREAMKLLSFISLCWKSLLLRMLGVRGLSRAFSIRIGPQNTLLVKAGVAWLTSISHIDVPPASQLCNWIWNARSSQWVQQFLELALNYQLMHSWRSKAATTHAHGPFKRYTAHHHSSPHATFQHENIKQQFFWTCIKNYIYNIIMYHII